MEDAVVFSIQDAGPIPATSAKGVEKPKFSDKNHQKQLQQQQLNGTTVEVLHKMIDLTPQQLKFSHISHSSHPINTVS